MVATGERFNFYRQGYKEDQKNYTEELVALHKIIVLSMKVKQTVDPKVVADLEEAVLSFKKIYNEGKEGNHH